MGGYEMAKNLKINALSSVAQTILNLGLMVLLYRQVVVHLGTERLGVWAIILSSTTFFNLSNLGITGGVTPFVSTYHAQNDTLKVVQTIQTAFSITTGITGLLSLLAYPLVLLALPTFIGTKYLGEAQALLPLAILSFWLNTVAGVFLSGIDGLHKMYLRSALSSSISAIYLVLALVLVRPFGLQGMAYAQIVQAMLLLLIGAYLLKQELPNWFPFSFKIEPAIFRKLFRYGMNFQLMYIAQVVSDPVTKVLVAKFGNLQSVAFYEMGIKIIGIFRNILVSANQAIVPTVATESAEKTSNIVGLYHKNLSIIRTLSLLIYPAFVCFSWLISEGWLGKIEPEFVLFLIIIAIGYGFNTLSLPVHFINLGIGQLHWNVLATLASAATMITLGMAFGWYFGAVGVVAAWTVSALVGTMVLVSSFQRTYSLNTIRLDKSDQKLLISNGLSLIFCWLCYQLGHDWPFWFTASICCMVYGTLTGLTLRQHLVFEYFRNIFADLLKTIQKRPR